ncbi:nucleoside hydrolase [Paramaledivibacter caminithermalis]|uniref:Inosine-uridine nucleoside N-ribohydrolase n=1 Tax=Paramaledivibacter caminithermalis (strain DSM 15212 / CIP 107654 / DViRD3) TaxID=1121301 RepID=A0A1M6MYD2_PARC5|nr:nucleoside hydrolase [Paramaledivibacter caminithermalis]SHJ88467.1 Inosine-uridine nucleoside N-ribohydrolase [Paramaledivibacter caminithermalis DSM 15212]
MHKVIFDCDNTMGVENCDVDDGLTLLYLLGRQDIDLLGVTTTFGNSKIDIVYNNTIKMFNELKLNDIPLYKGASSSKDRQSEAAEFLTKMTKKYPGEIILLATGSLTNLLGAYELDNNFFNNLKEIVLMGGITEPLIINGKNLDELNFSCDSEATYKVLSSNTNVTVITGHICLQAFFGENEYKRLMENDSVKIYQYIRDKTINWFEFIMQKFGIKGFYNWDIVASVYITHPELFDRNIQKITSTSQDLDNGYLKINNLSGNSYEINIPTKIKDIDKFNKVIFDSWAKVKI